MLSMRSYNVILFNIAILYLIDSLPGIVALTSYNTTSHKNLTAVSNEHPRFKRQSTRCRSSQWKCRDGQCIAIDGKCDGSVDCQDGSDEILATCRDNKCPGYLFRCTYGACVDGDAKCNGRQDCADNSDELNRDCTPITSPANGNCRKDFTCSDGTCIGQDRVCDGVPDCPDLSDETVLQCGSLQCASYLFRCAYGACVDGGSNCNGRQDCADGSDESDELCKPNVPGSTSTTKRPLINNTTSKPGSCLLPPYPENGKYTVQADPNLVPGSYTDYVILDYTCNKGYGLTGDSNIYCISGMWAKLPKCSRLCRPLISTTVNFECRAADSTINIPCNQTLASGTIVTPACKPSYYSSSPLKKLTCVDGSWEYTPTCTPGLLKYGANITIVIKEDISIYTSKFNYTVPFTREGLFDLQSLKHIVRNDYILDSIENGVHYEHTTRQYSRVDSADYIDENDWRMGISNEKGSRLNNRNIGNNKEDNLSISSRFEMVPKDNTKHNYFPIRPHTVIDNINSNSDTLNSIYNKNSVLKDLVDRIVLNGQNMDNISETKIKFRSPRN